MLLDSPYAEAAVDVAGGEFHSFPAGGHSGCCIRGRVSTTGFTREEYRLTHAHLSEWVLGLPSSMGTVDRYWDVLFNVHCNLRLLLLEFSLFGMFLSSSLPIFVPFHAVAPEGRAIAGFYPKRNN